MRGVLPDVVIPIFGTFELDDEGVRDAVLGINQLVS